MTTNPQGFAYYETEAARLATRIRDLKALTPEFTEVRDQAQRQMERHFELIEQEEATLTDLRRQAAEAAMLLGAEPVDGAAEDLAEEQRQIEAILNDDTPFEGISPAEEINPAEELAEAIAAGHPAADPPATFATVGDIAEQITAALANMAINQPDTADLSDSPELTTEQTEAVEQNMAEALKAYA